MSDPIAETRRIEAALDAAKYPVATDCMASYLYSIGLRVPVPPSAPAPEAKRLNRRWLLDAYVECTKRGRIEINFGTNDLAQAYDDIAASHGVPHA